MKSISSMALGIALTLGTGMLASTPAIAKKDKEDSKAAAIKISDTVRKPLAGVQDALAKNDLPRAEAGLVEARAAAKTEEDKFVISQFQLQAAVKSQDTAKQVAAIDAMIATGRLTAEEQPKFYFYQGQFAYQAKDYAKAATALSNAIRTGSKEANAPVLLADSYNRTGNTAQAIATLEAAVAANTAAGQPTPSDWYARGVDMASRAGLQPEFIRLTTAWLAAYPVKQNWHDSLFILRQMKPLPAEQDLDLLRLARASGVLNRAAQNVYLDYALATYLRYPNEAVTVLKEGIAAGKVNTAASRNAKEILELSQPKVAADKASLAASAANAATKGTYKGVTGTADAYYGYGEYQKAAELYRVALTKPGSDAGLINLRLGASLAQAGDKEGARAAFKAVTGASQPIAAYWQVLLDHPAQ